jgi:hypothetical protein
MATILIFVKQCHNRRHTRQVVQVPKSGYQRSFRTTKNILPRTNLGRAISIFFVRAEEASCNGIARIQESDRKKQSLTLVASYWLLDTGYSGYWLLVTSYWNYQLLATSDKLLESLVTSVPYIIEK